MKSKVLKWCLKIEKHYSLGAYQDVVDDLRSLSALLTLSSPLSKVVKIDTITRLQHLLFHVRTDVARSALCVLNAMDDLSDLPSELTLSLMQQATSVLHSSTGIVSERISLVCEVITNVAQCDNENVKTILNSSGCLKNILSVFSNIDMTKSSLENINWLANAIMSALSNETRILIGDSVIPKVVSCLNIWLDEHEPVVEMSVVLKELLFLCREVISSYRQCQNMFLQYSGLEALVRGLEKCYANEIRVATRKCEYIDYSPTLFSSLVILMDATVTHNREACRRAANLNAIEILKHHLITAADEQQKVFIVQTIVHILEPELETPSPWTASLLDEIYFLVIDLPACPTQIVKYLWSHKQEVKEKLSNRKCTPHPKRNLSLKRYCTQWNGDPLPERGVEFQHQELPNVENEAQKKRMKIIKTPHPNKKINPKKICTPWCNDGVLNKDEEGVDRNEFEFELPSNRELQEVPRRIDTPHPNKRTSLKKSLKRLEGPATNIDSSPQNNVRLKASICEADTSSTKYKKYFISQAELLLLMHCVQIYGVNMDNIRRVFPFHQDLTAADLYALWRAIWSRNTSKKIY